MNARLLAPVIMAAIVGCGGDDGGNCGKIAPCGGDLVGTWRFADVCHGASFGFSGCAAATLDLSARTTTGVMTFHPDMTYDVDATVGGTDKVTFPSECWGGPGLADCGLLEAELSLDAGLETSVRCSGSGGGCVCWLTSRPAKSYEAGEYALESNVVTYRFGSMTATHEYCVQGNELHLTSTEIIDRGASEMVVSSSFALRR